MRRRIGTGGAALLALGLAASGAGPGAADEALLEQACAACHAAGEGGLSRIAGQRKTPEGWLMTIVRMRIAHGAEIGAEEQARLVRYLSETQGLAPSETEGLRYALEKDPDVVEAFEEPFGSMCARCHTGARGLLQKRTAEEWALLMEFHVGQFPTIEYQALGRDREWYRIARDEIATYLAETHPLESEAWNAWQAAEKPEVAGDWIVLTELPGRGRAYGRLTVEGADGAFSVTGELRDAEGKASPVSGRMNLYTGYEWRANLDIDGTPMRQVLAVSEDGRRIAGRLFSRAQDSLGAPLEGVRADGPATVLGAVPEAGQGRQAELQVVGSGLGDLAVDGATVEDATTNEFGARLRLVAEEEGTVTIAGTPAFAFYDAPDRVTVEPAFTIARVGGGGEEAPVAMPAHFRAIGWWNGPDGEPGTEDDIRIGALDARWEVENAHEVAADMEDLRFAGTMEETGIFQPAMAGPNPERRFSTNNAGELTVRAEVGGVTGEAHLIVTVQRFIDPPIR